MSNGISISQSGVPVDRAADYQKTIDSRWKFLEVEKEGYVDIEIPAIAAGGSTTLQFSQRVLVKAHDLGYFPLFQASATVIKGTPLNAQSPGDPVIPAKIYADEKNVYLFPSYQASDGQAAVTVRVRYRVFAVDLLEEYEAPGLSPVGSNGSASTIGIKFLDGTGDARIDQDSLTGFSADSTKKTLSIHKITAKNVTATDNMIPHNVGYPPSYMIAQAPQTFFSIYAPTFTIPWRDTLFCGPEFDPIARVTADLSIIKFVGVQSVFQGYYSFVIIKDPMDLSS